MDIQTMDSQQKWIWSPLAGHGQEKVMGRVQKESRHWQIINISQSKAGVMGDDCLLNKALES